LASISLITLFSILTSLFSGKFNFLPHDLSSAESTKIINSAVNYSNYLPKQAQQIINPSGNFHKAMIIYVLICLFDFYAFSYYAYTGVLTDNFFLEMVLSSIVLLVGFMIIIHFSVISTFLPRKMIIQYLQLSDPQFVQHYYQYRNDPRLLRDLMVQQVLQQDFNPIIQSVRKAIPGNV